MKFDIRNRKQGELLRDYLKHSSVNVSLDAKAEQYFKLRPESIETCFVSEKGCPGFTYRPYRGAVLEIRFLNPDEWTSD